jgi:rhodanese-related sulfurtransferase
MMTSIETLRIQPSELRNRLAGSDEIALLDVREEGEYGEGHPLLAVNVPYSRLELLITAVVPRRATPIVLIDGCDGVAERATRRLRLLGYSDVRILGGGAAGWERAGYHSFEGQNVPSKALSEVVEHAFHTPCVTPEELSGLLAARADVVLLDCRTEEEFDRFHVPSAISCPGAELVWRFKDLVPSPDSLVVVSCAGRTRGILGAQSLINAGIPNRVVHLKGGTQGWVLAGLPLASGGAEYGVTVSAEAAETAIERAKGVAIRFGVLMIDHATLTAWHRDPSKTTYLFDVRGPAEYAAGHLQGAISAPGVQLVQRLDRWVGTRNARLVVVDQGLVRAIMTAHWLKQMGWHVSVLDGPVGPGLPTTDAPRLPDVREINASEAAAWLAQSAKAISVDLSADHRRSHAEGAIWVNRARLDRMPADVLNASRIVVFSEDGQLARLAAQDLAEISKEEVVVVRGGLSAWRDAGLPLASSPGQPPDNERIDNLFWNQDRVNGNLEHSRAYLAWEEDLPRQIEVDGASGFRLMPEAVT